METKVRDFKQGKIEYPETMRIFNGWNAHAKWANRYKIRKSILNKIYKSTQIKTS